MNKIMLIFLIFFISPSHAEVFKCVLENKTVYQPDPCPAAAVKQAEIVIEKPNPAKVAEAEAKLKEWKSDFARREAEEQQVRKERQDELNKQAEIDAINRNARAQEELAEAAKHPTIINRPYFVSPYFSPYQHPNDWGFGQQHRHDIDHHRQAPREQAHRKLIIRP